uniref:Uncharacterized protein n=1 Tax=Ciona savignyi TaxID=51511 RepID=H2ZH67_CIOSA
MRPVHHLQIKRETGSHFKSTSSPGTYTRMFQTAARYFDLRIFSMSTFYLSMLYISFHCIGLYSSLSFLVPYSVKGKLEFQRCISRVCCCSWRSGVEVAVWLLLLQGATTEAKIIRLLFVSHRCLPLRHSAFNQILQLRIVYLRRYWIGHWQCRWALLTVLHARLQ